MQAALAALPMHVLVGTCAQAGSMEIRSSHDDVLLSKQVTAVVWQPAVHVVRCTAHQLLENM